MRKKDKLYTANKWNRPLFVQGIDRENRHIFDGSPDYMSSLSGSVSTPSIDYGKLGMDAGKLSASTEQMNAQNLSMNDAAGAKSSFGSGKGFGYASGIVGAMPTTNFKIGGNETRNGVFDALDPMWHLAAGRESKAGNAMSDIGVGLTKSGNPWLMLAGAGMKILGGLTNSIWGNKFNQENIDRINSNNRSMVQTGNALGNAQTNEDLASFGNINLGSDFSLSDVVDKTGWSHYAHRKARKKYNSLKRGQAQSRAYTIGALQSAATNIDNAQDNDVMANTLFSYGGPIDQINPNDMGAIGYGFMSDYLTMKDNQAQNKGNFTNMFAGTPSSFFAKGGDIHIKKVNEGKFTEQARRAGMGVQEYAAHVLANKEDYPPLTVKRANFAKNAAGWKHCGGGRLFDIGGDIQTNGADFTTGLMQVNAGQSHELNPYDGVQMGIAPDGKPNLVEEDETIFNDYVYSNRIMIDDDTKKRFHINKKREMSYADLSKRLEKEASERPNDPLSMAALKAQMQELADQQERQKAEIKAQEAREAFESLTPEEQTALMQQKAMQEQQMMQQEAMAQQQAQQMSPEEQAMLEQQMIAQQQGAPEEGMYADGGILKFVQGHYRGDLPFEKVAEAIEKDMIARGIKKTKGATVRHKDGTVSQSSRFNTNDIYAAYQDLFAPTTKGSDLINRMERLVTAGYSPKTAHSYVYRVADRSKYKSETDYNRAVQARDDAYRELVAPNESKKAQSKEERVTSAAQPAESAAANQTASVSNTGNDTVARVPVSNNGINPYDYYTNGNDGTEETPVGFTVGDNGLIDKENGYTQEYRDKVASLGADDIRAWAAEHPNDPSLLSFLAAGNKLENLTDDQWRTGATDGKYGFMHHVADRLLQETPEETTVINNDFEVPDGTGGKHILVDDNGKWTELDPNALPDNVELWKMEDGTPYIPSNNPEDQANTYYRAKAAAEAAADVDASANANASTNTETQPVVVPNHKAEWPRYAGLFGPAVGLGLMAAGVGKPDYKGLDAALEIANKGGAQADYKPIGNYLAYRPMDVWAEQNRNNASARATDRAIMNRNAPTGTQMAGLLASGYNDQLANGQLYRNALEYNDNQRAKVADFNRGTEMFNAQAYNHAALANAQMRNRQNQLRASLAMDAARTRLDNDASWYNNIYGNLTGLFGGLSELGRENAQHNMIARMIADGVIPMTTKQYSGKGYIKEEKTKSKGGKINKKRGLTF